MSGAQVRRSRPGARRPARGPLALLSCAALGFALGCDGGALAPDAGPDAAAAGAAGSMLLLDDAPAFLTRMVGVLDDTHFKGRRVIWSRPLTPGNAPVGGVAPIGTVGSIGSTGGAGSAGTGLSVGSAGTIASPGASGRFPWDGLPGVSTRQDVASDGDGRFAIELVDILQLPPGANEFVFPVAFEAGVGAQWRIREFRVRDANLLWRNYTVVPPTGSVQVAGITCETMILRRLQPVGDRPGHYELDVDPGTGFVLAMREYDANGRILQGFEYEEFAYGADLSTIRLRESGRFPATEIDLDQPLVPQVDFRPLVPDVFPQGFELIAGARFEIPAAAVSGHGAVQDPDRSFLPPGPWVRFDATDGIELVRFAHDKTDQVDSATAVRSSVLRILEEGTWNVAFASVRGVSIVITGRVGIDGMRLAVESAF